MRSAHALSRRYVIDPQYSATRLKPEPAGRAIFTTRRGKTVGGWLYAPGDLEAHLLSRMRLQAFRECLNVFHPGLFRRPAHMLMLRRTFAVRNTARKAAAAVHHSGQIQLKINDRLVLHLPACPRPTVRRIDLAPFLRRGSNTAVIILNRIDAPPAVAISSAVLPTDDNWEISRDGMHYERPNVVPFTNATTFPHDETLPAVRLSANSSEARVFDFGVELIGRPILTTQGQGTLQVYPGESIAEANNTNASGFEQPPFRASIAGSCRTAGQTMAFRYLRVKTPGTVTVQSVTADAEFYPAIYQGAFACSDPLLTRIWMHAAYTLRLCMRELFVDGLKRDRLPWVGDLYLAILCNAFSFADAAIARRTLTALAPEDPHVCHSNGIIDYTLYWLISLDAYRLYFDDEEFIRWCQPKVLQVLAALEAGENKEGFLIPRPDDWLFIDWAEMDKTGVVGALQMLYVAALNAAAAITGEHTPARKAARLRNRIRERFWDSRRGAFVDNILSSGRRGARITRQTNALAVFANVATAAQGRQIAVNVLQNPAVAPVGTPYMRFMECIALARLGRVAQMLDNIREYWGAMLNEGATTFWEAYNPRNTGREHLAFYGRPFANSLCHAWSAGPVFLLSSLATGISPGGSGWKTRALTHPRTNLEWIAATIPTPRARLHVEREQDRTTVRISRR